MTNSFENSKAIMVTHYQGLTMPQLDELRSKMREHGIILKLLKIELQNLLLRKLSVKIYQIYLLVQLLLHLEKTL